MTENHEEEQQWLARLRAGEEVALDFIFEKYYPYLYRIAFQILSDANTSKDMAQEVFLRFWRNRESIQVNSTLKGYLHRAIVNQCISQKRSQSRISYPEHEFPSAIAEQVSMQSVLEAQNLEARVQAAINLLPDQCALVFRLSRFEELSYQEIARQLGIAPKTVENQIGKALKFLRQALQPYLSIILLAGAGNLFYQIFGCVWG